MTTPPSAPSSTRPHARPHALLVMNAPVLPRVLPEPVLARLRGSVELPVAEARPGLAEFPAEVLKEVEVLVTGWGCAPLTEELLDAAPRLSAVVHAAGTVKGFATPAVWERGIAVSSAAGVNALPVAEFAVAALVLSAKGVFRFARSGLFPPDRSGMGNHGRVVGVVGASRIGRIVLERLKGYGVRVLVHDPYLDADEARALGAEPVDLDTLVSSSDAVSLHAPSLPETRHMIDARRLALMKDGAFLLNTARGALLDHDALAAECANGRIEALLDVTEPEPLPADHPLRHLPHVTLTPHVAGSAGNETARLGEFAVEEVERHLAGLPLRGAVTAADLARTA